MLLRIFFHNHALPGAILFPEMLNKLEETSGVTEMLTFKHEPCWGWRGGGAYLWYFTVHLNVYLSSEC